MANFDVYHKFMNIYFNYPYYELNHLYPFYHLARLSPSANYDEYIQNERLRSAKRRNKLYAEYEYVVSYAADGSEKTEVVVPIVPVSLCLLGTYSKPKITIMMPKFFRPISVPLVACSHPMGKKNEL